MDSETIARTILEIAEDLHEYAKDGDSLPFTADVIRDFGKRCDQLADEIGRPKKRAPARNLRK